MAVISIQTLCLRRRDIPQFKESLGYEATGLLRLSSILSVFRFFVCSVWKSEVVEYKVDLLSAINPVPGLKIEDFGSTLKQSKLFRQFPAGCKFAVIESDPKAFRVPLYLTEALFLIVKRGLRNSNMKDSVIEKVILKVISDHHLDELIGSNQIKARIFHQIVLDTVYKLGIKYIFFEGDFHLTRKLNTHNLILITPGSLNINKTKDTL